MKAHVADYATRVYCVRIEPANTSPIVRVAGYPVDLAMSNGEVYLTESGYEFSGLGASSTFASSSIDLNGILQVGAVSKEQLESGVYDNARIYLFATSWAAPIEDEEPLSLMFMGKVDYVDNRYTAELMGAIDVLSQATSRTYSATCPWTLFDETLDGHVLPWSQSKCTGPRAAQDGPLLTDFKVTGTLTSVTDQYMFADSVRTEVSDWFAYGSIRLTSGPNAGLKPIQIKAFTAGGVILLHEAMFYLPQVGDAYEMVPGCRKRHAEDCIGKWGNGINFGGQPHIPVPSVYGQVGRKQ
nr:DUF2163 domain-containing protein [Pseudomonas sp. UBA6718]